MLQDKSEKESWTCNYDSEEFVQGGFRILVIGTIDIDLEELVVVVWKVERTRGY